MLSTKANIDTNAIRFARIAPIGFSISIAPLDIASNTLLNFLFNWNQLIQESYLKLLKLLLTSF